MELCLSLLRIGRVGEVNGMSDEQLFLIEPDVTVLRPVEMEGARRGGIWKPLYWVCLCGATLHHTQVIPHLCRYHFYSKSDARYMFQQAKLGNEQNLPTLVNLLKD